MSGSSHDSRCESPDERCPTADGRQWGLRMRAIDRWRQLTRVEKTLVVRAAAAVATMALGVRAFGLKRMLRMPAVDRAGRSRTEPAHVAELVAAVDRAGRYVPGGSCLAQ